MPSPIDLIRQGLREGSFILVADGFNRLTGEAVTPFEMKPPDCLGAPPSVLEALAFYANPKSWIGTFPALPPVGADCGRLAAKALGLDAKEETGDLETHVHAQGIVERPEKRIRGIKKKVLTEEPPAQEDKRERAKAASSDESEPPTHRVGRVNVEDFRMHKEGEAPQQRNGAGEVGCRVEPYRPPTHNSFRDDGSNPASTKAEALALKKEKEALAKLEEIEFSLTERRPPVQFVQLVCRQCSKTFKVPSADVPPRFDREDTDGKSKYMCSVCASAAGRARKGN